MYRDRGFWWWECVAQVVLEVVLEAVLYIGHAMSRCDDAVCYESCLSMSRYAGCCCPSTTTPSQVPKFCCQTSSHSKIFLHTQSTMKDLCKNWWNRIRSRPDSDRIQALPISSPRSINDEFHSLGPMSPVSPGDFVTEDYVDMADDQRDGFYRYSASIYGDDTPSPTGSLIVRPSSNDDLSDHFIVTFFPPPHVSHPFG